MMDNVIGNSRAFRGAKSIYSSHIRKLTPPQMMNMVELYLVPFRWTWRISPHPTGRNATVPEISYFIMGQFIIAGIKYDYPDCTWKNMPCIPDYIIVDGNVVCDLLRILTDNCFPDFNSPGAKIMHIALIYRTITTCFPE